MIGEGIQSTNQRKHSYVQDHVEVGFFTDPSVCIGCKACEVACKEWNQVPGRRLHVVGKFLRQHRPPRRIDLASRHVSRTRSTKGKSDHGTDGSARSAIGLIRHSRRRRKIPFAGFFCPMFASIARKPVALKRVRLDRSCALKSGRCWCKTMSAMAAATASSRVRLA